MKLLSRISILLSIIIFFSLKIYSAEPASSSVTKQSPIVFSEHLSDLIQESYKKVGMQKTLELLNSLKKKLKNDPELNQDINCIINKINAKNSINESITFPAELSNIILDYVNPYQYEEFTSFDIYPKEIRKLA